MYSLLINNENSVISYEVERIMQKSNAANQFRVVVPKLDINGKEMRNISLYMKYVLPVSHIIRQTLLELSDDDYQGKYLVFSFPTTVRNFTSEAGTVEISFTFVEPSSDPTVPDYVRKTLPGFVEITPLAQFDTYVPDEMLDELDQRLLVLDAKIKDLANVGDIIQGTAPNDLVISPDGEKIVLTNGEEIVGDGVDIDVISKIVAEEIVGEDTDGTADGVIHIDEIPTEE